LFTAFERQILQKVFPQSFRVSVNIRACSDQSARGIILVNKKNIGARKIISDVEFLLIRNAGQELVIHAVD
jgi:hypothetical protein